MAIASRTVCNCNQYHLDFHISREEGFFSCMCVLDNVRPGADPGFLERGCVCINVCKFALLTFSHFS